MNENTSDASKETSGRGAVPRSNVNIETPIELRRLTERTGDSNFSGFAPESLRRILELEKELRFMKELIAEVWEKQDLLQSE